MQNKNYKTSDTEVISMEEYLNKRKKIREKENRKNRKVSEAIMKYDLTPFEYYLVSSSSWS